MITSGLVTGLQHTEQMRVEEQHTVPYVEPTWPGFADMPPAFATAMLIGFIEQTCIQALRPHLGPGQHTVGVHVDVSHIAATPVGMTVTATVELNHLDGRTLYFAVTCHDEDGPIGQGTHQRSIIDADKFTNRLARKGHY